uniref:Uncharacterized protein n=1 Tax=Ditylenchus dipsaci TaxID=166011 RepID=A0A915DWU1_9BILA
MERVWAMMQNSQLKEGVDSLLVDLLSIVEMWLKVDENSFFTQQQFRLMTELLDPRFVTRTLIVLKCFCLPCKTVYFRRTGYFFIPESALQNLLFVGSNEDSTQLLDLLFSTLVQLTQILEENKISEVTSLQKCIGYWISCLIMSTKTLRLMYLRIVLMAFV